MIMKFWPDQLGQNCHLLRQSSLEKKKFMNKKNSLALRVFNVAEQIFYGKKLIKPIKFPEFNFKMAKLICSQVFFYFSEIIFKTIFYFFWLSKQPHGGRQEQAPYEKRQKESQEGSGWPSF